MKVSADYSGTYFVSESFEDDEILFWLFKSICNWKEPTVINEDVVSVGNIYFRSNENNNNFSELEIVL